MDKPLRVPRRRPLRLPGEDTDEAILVRSGILGLFAVGLDGHRHLVALRFAGDAVLPRRPANIGIHPLVDSEVLIEQPGRQLFDEADAFDHARRNEAIACHWILRLGSMDASTRLANLLCEVIHRTGFGVEFLLPLTQLQMGEITGQTSVNVNRVMRQLNDDGLILRSGQRVVVPNLAALWRRGAFHPEHLGG